MNKVEVMIGETPSLEATIPEYKVIGTTHHSQLSERDLPDQHPISAITGLGEALDEAINVDELQEAVEDALTVAKESGEFKGDQGEAGPAGVSGVYFGSDTPPESANVWINPNGEPTGTENWEFDLDDGTSDTKTVVVIDSDESTQSGTLAILKFKQEDSTWAEVPAIVGSTGPQGEKGDTGEQGPQGIQGAKGDKGDIGPAGASGVHIGSDTPPETASVWINPNGEPTGTEDWQFDLDDGTSDTKTVVVIDSDDSTSSGTLAVLRFKQADGTWAEIPSIVGEKGETGATGPQGATGATGPQGPQGEKGETGAQGPQGEKGDQGDPYVLTDADKSEIAAKVKSSITTADISGAADTNYTALKARAESLNSAEATPSLNGAIAWTYE